MKPSLWTTKNKAEDGVTVHVMTGESSGPYVAVVDVKKTLEETEELISELSNHVHEIKVAQGSPADNTQQGYPKIVSVGFEGFTILLGVQLAEDNIVYVRMDNKNATDVSKMLDNAVKDLAIGYSKHQGNGLSPYN